MSEDTLSSVVEQQCLIKSINLLAELCVQRDVKIIANQKVVSQNLKEIFQQKKIIVLERLGREGIARLKKVARCHDSILKGISKEPSILETLPEYITNKENVSKVT